MPSTTFLINLLPIAAVFLLAGTIKGGLGLGLPAIAVGLLGLLMPPAQAAAILVVPSLVTNVWQVMAGPDPTVLVRRLGSMMFGIVVGTMAGAGLITGHATLPTAALGLALIAYAGTSLARLEVRIPRRAERWAGPLAGLLTGVVTGATGIFSIPAIPYIGGLGLSRDDLVQALGISFTTSTLALACGLAWYGALPTQALGASLLAVPPALAGMALGGWLRTRISPAVFRLSFLIGLLLLGVQLTWRGLS